MGRLKEPDFAKFYSNFHNIRDIDEDAYDEFIEYKPLIKNLAEGKKISPKELLKTSDSLIKTAAIDTSLEKLNVKKKFII